MDSDQLSRDRQPRPAGDSVAWLAGVHKTHGEHDAVVKGKGEIDKVSFKSLNFSGAWARITNDEGNVV